MRLPLIETGTSLEDRSRWTYLDREAVAARAKRSLSSTPRPFLRWAGSKRRLLSHLVGVLPARFRVYHEPFLGGGSLFFLLRPRMALLGDTCSELIDTYQAVSVNPAAVLRYLAPLKVDRSTYYKIRGNRSDGEFKRAAQFVYLNKAGWNGLYRVNSSGEFNVPFGAPKSDNLIDRANLVRCAATLAAPGVSLSCRDFNISLAEVSRGDLVFLDPPYVTRHNNNGFVDYNERLFSWADQERLAAEAARLAEIGAQVIVCNANHSDIVALYPGFTSVEVVRPSTLASSRHARGRVSEAIFVSACLS
jgi:DNA adenine methylase